MPINDDATLANTIGCNIKKIRGSRSQRDCAEAIGASQPQWAAWEAGKNIPGEEYLKAIAAMFGVTKKSLWASGSPPAPASGEESLLPHLSRMAVELMDIMNDIHLRALEGTVTEEQFKAILAGATGGMLEAARENEVETKKGTA